MPAPETVHPSWAVALMEVQQSFGDRVPRPIGSPLKSWWHYLGLDDADLAYTTNQQISPLSIA